MKVSGFTITRNAILYDYPVVEAIESVLPLCDEFIVAVGKSEDETRKLVESISSDKIKIIDTVWDNSLKEGGKVLAAETNKAFNAVSPDSDWAFYIQSDEILHEKYIDAVIKGMEKYKDDPKVEGLLFNYLHFYGSYEFIGDSRKWYRREVRVIRNDKQIHSFKDAQGFRKNGNKLNVKLIDAFIYHYGWVKHPEIQQKKQETFNRLWHDDEWMDKNIAKVSEFDYSQIDSLKYFTDSHPKVIQERINRMNWKFDFDPTQSNMKLLYGILRLIEDKTGWRIGEYKNYNLV